MKTFMKWFTNQNKIEIFVLMALNYILINLYFSGRGSFFLVAAAIAGGVLVVKACGFLYAIKKQRSIDR